jgi:hypothetical protein
LNQIVNPGSKLTQEIQPFACSSDRLALCWHKVMGLNWRDWTESGDSLVLWGQTHGQLQGCWAGGKAEGKAEGEAEDEAEEEANNNNKNNSDF